MGIASLRAGRLTSRAHTWIAMVGALLALAIAAIVLPSAASAQTAGVMDFQANSPNFGSAVTINRPGGSTAVFTPGVFDIDVTSGGSTVDPPAAFCVDLDTAMAFGSYNVIVQTPTDTPAIDTADYRAAAWLTARAPALVAAATNPGLEAGALQVAVWMLTGQASTTNPIAGSSGGLEARALALYALAQGKSLTPLTITAAPTSADTGATVTLNLTGTEGTTATLAITSGTGTLGATTVTFDAANQASTTLTGAADGTVTVTATTDSAALRRAAKVEQDELIAQDVIYLVPGSAQVGVPFSTPTPPPTPPTPPSPPVTPSGPPATPPAPPAPPVTPVGPSNVNVCLRPDLRVQVMGTRRTRAGNTYKYKVKVTNRSGRNVAEMVQVRIQIPRGYSIVRRPRGSRLSGGSVIVPLRNIGPRRMRMTMVTLRADRDTAGNSAVRAFVSAKCTRRRAGVLRIRTRPLVQQVSPAVTG